jgi:hypothetical protein
MEQGILSAEQGFRISAEPSREGRKRSFLPRLQRDVGIVFYSRLRFACEENKMVRDCDPVAGSPLWLI